MMEKKCSKCGIVKPLDLFDLHGDHLYGRRTACKECRSEENKINRESIQAMSNRWRKANPDKVRVARKRHKLSVKARDPIKFKAWKKTQDAISRGRVHRQHCCICGNQKSEAHHTDYTQPLKITWMCMKCHRTAHKLDLGSIDFGSYPYNINSPKYPIINGVEQRG